MSLAPSPDLPHRAAPVWAHWSKVWAWLVMGLAVVLLWLVPSSFNFPEPQSGLRLTSAELDGPGSDTQEVTLPFLWSSSLGEGAESARFRLRFDAEDLSARPLAVFIPAARQPMEMLLNGAPLEPSRHIAQTSARAGYFLHAILPEAALAPGENTLDLVLLRNDGWVTGYLSAVHVMAQADLEDSLRLHDVIIDQGRAISFALQLLLAVSVVVIIASRRQDQIFVWFGMVGLASLPVALLQSTGMEDRFGDLRAAILALQLLIALLILRVGYVVIGRQPGPWMGRAMLGLPLGFWLLSLLPILPQSLVVLACAICLAGAYALAALLLGQHFARHRDWVAALFCPPCALDAICAVHDILLAFGLTGGDYMLAPYARFVHLAAVMALLIGHLIQSLNRGDAAQALMQQRLAEQEAELRRLHCEERERIGQQVLVRERERLMRDLHDGISGHLVSILAQAEKQGEAGRGVQVSASEALSDLRMVVQSLDLGEDDLRLALAGFHERLQPQLRRQGVRLNWSMEQLPEVSGMSSGTALAILRILQEAVTNALKHGPAAEISITGRAAAFGAEIVILNGRDPQAARPAGQGHGLANMRRRAQSFGGELDLTLTPTSAALVLSLPLRLRDAAGQGA